MELPAIMKWIKQTFAKRYNRMTGRIGHIWGDRYWSAVLEGEPPGGAELSGKARQNGSGAGAGVRPPRRKQGRGPRFSALSSAPPAPVPG
jgi:hypothetical protein